MTTAEITERMGVLLDAALAVNRCDITPAQYNAIVGCGIDAPWSRQRTLAALGVTGEG